MATLLHVDMDAFFASVELLHHPEWRGRPLIVGSGPHERGVVSTCSYEARKFGVHSAMPSRTAYQLCPHAVFTPPDMKLYAEVSRQAFAVFERFTPFVEGVSIDEAFLDIDGTLHLYADRADTGPCEARRRLGEALRTAVREACGVTCSVGIAPNRLLAKIGSEQNKPDGLTLMPFEADKIAAFLAPRPLGILWGVGHATKALLARYGIVTCGDVQRLVAEADAAGRHAEGSPCPALERILGASAAATLSAYAFGRADDRVYWQDAHEKSVSREHTFDTDEPSRAAVRAKLLELVGEVGRRFRAETRWATTARIKVRDAAFKTFTRQIPFDAPACDDMSFRAKALALFDAALPPDETLEKSVRLIGFGVTNIVDSPDADGPLLFALPEDAQREKRERLSAALDSLRQRGLHV